MERYREVKIRRFFFSGSFLLQLSTHMDTVPPHIPSREDEDRIWGRGACDAKGIVASMIHAATALLEDGVRNFGLLFVVGEEKNSASVASAPTPLHAGQ